MITLPRKNILLLAFLFTLSCNKDTVLISKQPKKIDMLNIDYVDDPNLIPVIKELQSN